MANGYTGALHIWQRDRPGAALEQGASTASWQPRCSSLAGGMVLHRFPCSCAVSIAAGAEVRVWVDMLVLPCWCYVRAVHHLVSLMLRALTSPNSCGVAERQRMLL